MNNGYLTKKEIEYLKKNYELVILAFGIAGIILAVLEYDVGYWVFGIITTLVGLSIKGYKLYKKYEKHKLVQKAKIKYGFKQIKNMTPYQFEQFVADALKTKGYKTEVTKGSGDFGIDVIARNKTSIIGIQAKHYKDKVGYKAVQEAYSGGKIWKCNEYWVVTSNEHYFTRQAKQGAIELGVKLFNINDFAYMLEKGFDNSKK